MRSGGFWVILVSSIMPGLVTPLPVSSGMRRIGRAPRAGAGVIGGQVVGRTSSSTICRPAKTGRHRPREHVGPTDRSDGGKVEGLAGDAVVIFDVIASGGAAQDRVAARGRGWCGGGPRRSQVAGVNQQNPPGVIGLDMRFGSYADAHPAGTM